MTDRPDTPPAISESPERERPRDVLCGRCWYPKEAHDGSGHAFESFASMEPSRAPLSLGELPRLLDEFRDAARHNGRMSGIPDDLAWQRIVREEDAARAAIESLFSKIEAERNELLRGTGREG